MKKEYKSPELFELTFNTADVISTSDNSYTYEASGAGDQIQIR